MHLSFKLIIALGNPGEEYRNTYHNVGFLALDWFLRESSAEEDITFKAAKHLFEYHKTGDVTWVKPLTFMNESGLATAEALQYFGVAPEEALVIHDDSDLHIGEYKLSFDASSAGHKGVESIIKHLGTQKFSRLRIGIRPAVSGTLSRRERVPDTVHRLKAEEFVLRKMSKANEKEFLAVFKKIAEVEKGLF